MKEPCIRVVFKMKKGPLTLLLFAVAVLMFAFASTYVNASSINARVVSSSANVQVDHVSHAIKIQEGALVIINDTMKLSPKEGQSTVSLEDFSLGFPFQYGFNLDYCFAYGASDPDKWLDVELNTGLGRLGFYGVNVVFPEQGISIGAEESYNLTVIFVFSSLISSESATLLKLDFPMYPSLTQEASSCDVTVILPPKANFTDSTFHERELDFNTTTVDDIRILKHPKEPLESFEYQPAWLSFNMTAGVFPIIEFDEIKREIALDQWGSIRVTDSYSITNKGYDLSNVKVGFPEGAYKIAVRDEMGSIGKSTEEETVTVNIRETLHKDGAGKFFLSYLVPWKKYISQDDSLTYNLNFTFFERFNWTIRKLTVSITLPQGAEFQISNAPGPSSIERSVFQETVTFAFFNVTPFEDLNFDVSYGYLVSWASFYPTLWMGVLIIIASAIAFLWRAPKPPAVPMVPVPPEDLRSFVEAYNGKTRILSELESMEEQLRKGKIPRRRYKVRKKMLDGRLSTLSRDLSNLGEKIRTAGPKYANIMRQIEVAETMLEGAETDIRRVEARYKRGELSKGAYGKLIEEYHRRTERARTTIDGVLLRLREEIR